jgi:putative transposase
MVEELSNKHAVRNLCEFLEVSRSGYYAWKNGQESARAKANRGVIEEIKQVFHTRRGCYGSPRITHELRRAGRTCNHKRVERLMRQEGLKARGSKRRKVRTTQSDHNHPIAPNLLLNRPAPVKADEVWVADITYVPTSEGWLFVAAVMDLYSRQILGWSVWESLMAGGALQALKRSLVKRGYPRGVIHHSDRGVLCLRRVSPGTSATRPDCQHEPQGQLLRQRGHGSILEHAQARGLSRQRRLDEGSRPSGTL